jgi:hypothetical protein
MATFSVQVVDLVGAFSDEDALDSFVTEGANEVINAMPNSMLERVAEETPVTDGTTTSEGHKVLHMLRNDGTIDQPCRSIPARKRGRVQDASDMEYATTSDPVYWIQDGKFNLFPNGNGLLVSVPTYSQVASGGNRIDASSAEGITNFPDEAEYLVTLYASIKALQQNMSGKTSDLPADITFPSIPILVIPTLASVGDLTLPVTPTVPTLSAQSVTITGTAPTYVKPTLSSQTAFTDYTSGLSEADPGVFSITSVPPSTPSLPSISSPGVSSVIISNIGTPPTYTVPTITSTAGSPDDLSDMIDSDWTALDYDFDDENIDFATWFQVLGDYIQNQEDTELAQIQMQKISTYINAYQSSMQNRLNVFNDANVEYQGKLQEAIQQAQINSQEARKEGDLTFQASIQDYTLELQKYSADVGKYQADIAKEVQEYGQKLSQYQLELNTSFQAWSKTESDNLAKYQDDIKNELNNFNDANVEYQAKLQKDIQDAQLSDANEARKLQKYSSEVQTYSAEVGARVQEWVNEEWNQNFQKYQQDYSSRLQEYGNDIQSYQNEVGKSVQDFSTKLQKHTTDYGWLQSQHQQLSADYQRGIQLLRGGTAPQ